MNEQTNLGNHIKKIYGYIRASRGGLLIAYTFMVTLNPGFGLDYSLMFNLIKIPSKTWQTVTMGGGCFVLGLLLLSWFWVTNSRHIEPVTHIYVWNVVAIFAFLGVMGIWVHADNPVFVYMGVTLLLVTQYLVVAVCILVGIQLISRYIEEGYESFAINAVVGINNIAANISQSFGTGPFSTYLQQSKFSDKSAFYVFVIFIESAIIPLVLFYYLISLKDGSPARKRINSLDSDERTRSASRHIGGSLLQPGLPQSGVTNRSGGTEL